MVERAHTAWLCILLCMFDARADGCCVMLMPLQVVRLSSWLCILLGVTSLAGGAEGVAFLTRCALHVLPRPPKWIIRYGIAYMPFSIVRMSIYLFDLVMKSYEGGMLAPRTCCPALCVVGYSRT